MMPIGSGGPTMVDKADYDVLTKPGDLLQSTASRMAEWVKGLPSDGRVPCSPEPTKED